MNVSVKNNEQGRIMTHNAFIQAMEFRHACKKFDTNKIIPDDAFHTILEAGRLTPSSFGLEPTRLVVVRNNTMRNQLKAVCWNQDQITDSSHVVLYLSKIMDMQHTSDYTTRMFLRKVGGDEEALKAYKDQRYAGFLRANGYDNPKDIFQWTARQAYLMASSMMNCAAFMGIDSCPIEGFEQDGVNKVLKLDTLKESVALLVTFGYRIAPPLKKSPRIDMQEFVRYI